MIFPLSRHRRRCWWSRWRSRWCSARRRRAWTANTCEHLLYRGRLQLLRGFLVLPESLRQGLDGREERVTFGIGWPENGERLGQNFQGHGDLNLGLFHLAGRNLRTHHRRAAGSVINWSGSARHGSGFSGGRRARHRRSTRGWWSDCHCARVCTNSYKRKRPPKGPLTYLRLWRRPRLAMGVSFKFRCGPICKPLEASNPSDLCSLREPNNLTAAFGACRVSDDSFPTTVEHLEFPFLCRVGRFGGFYLALEALL